MGILALNVSIKPGGNLSFLVVKWHVQVGKPQRYIPKRSTGFDRIYIWIYIQICRSLPSSTEHD